MASSKPFISPSIGYEPLEETLDIMPKGAQLQIGLPKELMFQENRVALTPEAVKVLTANGHRVVVESKCGEGANFTDRDFSEAGAKIVYSTKEVFECSTIVKSAPVCEDETDLLKRNNLLFRPFSCRP